MGKGEETRLSVLSAGVRLASERGIDGVSIGLLAEQVGLSKSGLFAHFRSKEALQIAILDESSERFVSLVVAPALKMPRGEPRVRALFTRWEEWSRADFLPGGCIFLRAMLALSEQPGAVRDRLVEIELDWLATISTALRIARDMNHFRADIECDDLARELAAYVYGSALMERMLGPANGAERMRAGIDRILATVQIER